MDDEDVDRDVSSRARSDLDREPVFADARNGVLSGAPIGTFTVHVVYENGVVTLNKFQALTPAEAVDQGVQFAYRQFEGRIIPMHACAFPTHRGHEHVTWNR